MDEPTFDFTFKYLKNNPGATEDAIRKVYREEQGKQTSNARLLEHS